MNQINAATTRAELAAYISTLGIDCDSDPEKVFTKLEQLLGESRCEQLVELAMGKESGASGSQDVYRFFTTAEEANLFISQQSPVMLDTSVLIYERLLPHLSSGVRVADLGCFTGGFVGWMAGRHPDCHFVGFDCNPKATPESPEPFTPLKALSHSSRKSTQGDIASAIFRA